MALTPAALLDPFVDASRKLTRFKTPYVKVTKTDGEETYRYDREPVSAEDALALLELDKLSYTLKYELLELEEWPKDIAALLPARLVSSMLVIAAFIVGRKATRAAESEPLLATTA